MMIYNGVSAYRQDPGLIRRTYLTDWWDYLIALGLVIVVFSIVTAIIILDLPSFLTFSWITLIDSEQSSGNVIMAPIFLGWWPLAVAFYLVLVAFIPYFSEIEERAFRSHILTRKERLKKSLIFGLVHMVMGVPFIISIVIGWIGWIYSIRYVKAYRIVYTNTGSVALADSYATHRAVSLHAKYNLIVITLAVLLVLLT
jgi:hypothetical protein